MILKRIKVNVGNILGVNCYIVQDEETKETMVIDPGGSVNKITDMLDALQAKVKYILLTHCHGDHIGGVNELKSKTGGTVLIHRFDEKGLNDPEISLTSHIGIQRIDIEDKSRLNEGDLIHVGNLEFKIIHTPGHTAYIVKKRKCYFLVIQCLKVHGEEQICQQVISKIL